MTNVTTNHQCRPESTVRQISFPRTLLGSKGGSDDSVFGVSGATVEAVEGKCMTTSPHWRGDVKECVKTHHTSPHGLAQQGFNSHTFVTHLQTEALPTSKTGPSANIKPIAERLTVSIDKDDMVYPKQPTNADIEFATKNREARKDAQLASKSHGGPNDAAGATKSRGGHCSCPIRSARCAGCDSVMRFQGKFFPEAYALCPKCCLEFLNSLDQLEVRDRGNAELEQKQHNLANMEKTLQEAIRGVEERQKQIREMEQHLQEDVESWKRAQEASNRELQERQDNAKMREENLASLQQRLGEKQEEVTILEREVQERLSKAELQGEEMKRMDADLQRKLEIANVLEQEKNELEQLERNVHNKWEELEQRNRDMLETINAKRLEDQQRIQEHASIKMELDARRTELTEKEMELAQNMLHLDAAKSIQDIDSMLADRRKDLQDIQEEIREKQSRLQSVADETTAKKAVKTELQAGIQRLQEELSRKRADLETVESCLKRRQNWKDANDPCEYCRNQQFREKEATEYEDGARDVEYLSENMRGGQSQHDQPLSNKFHFAQHGAIQPQSRDLEEGNSGTFEEFTRNRTEGLSIYPDSNKNECGKIHQDRSNSFVAKSRDLKRNHCDVRHSSRIHSAHCKCDVPTEGERLCPCASRRPTRYSIPLVDLSRSSCISSASSMIDESLHVQPHHMKTCKIRRDAHVCSINRNRKTRNSVGTGIPCGCHRCGLGEHSSCNKGKIQVQHRAVAHVAAVPPKHKLPYHKPAAASTQGTRQKQTVARRKELLQKHEHIAHHCDCALRREATCNCDQLTCCKGKGRHPVQFVIDVKLESHHKGSCSKCKSTGKNVTASKPKV